MHNLQPILNFITRRGLNHTVINHKDRVFVSVIIGTLSITDFTTLEDMIMNDTAFHSLTLAGDLITFTGDTK